jgi:hypothetical protein
LLALLIRYTCAPFKDFVDAQIFKMSRKFLQVYDVIFFITLLVLEEYFFSVVFIVVDTLPGLCLVWDRFKKERTWKVLKLLFHPINVLVWIIMTIIDEKHRLTLEVSFLTPFENESGNI